MERDWNAHALSKNFREMEKRGVGKVADLMLALKSQIPPHKIVDYLRYYVANMKVTPEVDLTLDLINFLLCDCNYNRTINNCLVQIYSQVIRSLFYQQLSSKLLRAKVFRKMWMPKLHPQLYIDLRTVVFRQTGVDLDEIHQSDAIQHIAQYYKNHVKLSPEQIAYYLPQYAQLNHPKGDTTPIHCLPASLVDKMHHMSIDDSDIEQVMLRLEVSSEKNDSVRKQLPEQVKRVRDFSAETIDEDIGTQDFRTKKVRVSEESVRFQTIPNKTVQKVQSLNTIRSMMNMLNDLNPYECKECGQKFSQESNRNEHQVNHITARLNEFKQKERYSKKGAPKANMLQNASKWSETDDLTYDTFQLPFTEKDHNNAGKECHFCKQSIKYKFKNDQWIFLNAIRVGLQKMIPVLPGQMRNEKDEIINESEPLFNKKGQMHSYVLMHYHCYKILKQPQPEQQ